MASDILTYQVADFCFSVEGMPFEPANMQPFKVEQEDKELIFHLRVVPDFPLTDATLLYKSPGSPGFPVIALYSLPNGYLFEMQSLSNKPIAGKLVTNSSFSYAELKMTGYDINYAINTAMMLLFTFNTAQKGALEMHSSVVLKDEKGYLFLGKSGTGKSTHSQLWLKHIPGTELLNDDNPVLRLLPDRSVRVYGSPWSGKTPCYKAKNAPVGAIVQLYQAPHNIIERLPVANAYASLMGSASSFRPIKPFSDGWHCTMEGICATIPFYRLGCLPDKDAATLCYQTVIINNSK